MLTNFRDENFHLYFVKLRVLLRFSCVVYFKRLFHNAVLSRKGR
jgi:hypothetical protein